MNETKKLNLCSSRTTLSWSVSSSPVQENLEALIECVRSCDQKPYLHNETKGGICIKIEFNPQKNTLLL